MSLLIHYEKGKLHRAEILYPRQTPSPVYAAKDGKTFIIGEVFGASYEEVANSTWRENPNVLNDFEGAFSIAYASEEICFYATDLNGIEAWYTYHKGDTFLLSDNFWDLVKVIKPKFEDLDPQEARIFLMALSIISTSC